MEKPVTEAERVAGSNQGFATSRVALVSRTLRPAEKPILLAIVMVFVLLAIGYSVAVPVFEAQDEPFHFAFADYLATTWRLPVLPRSPSEPSGRWKQEAGQPPLSYLLSALLIAPIDRTDFPSVSRPNPFAALGTARLDNANVNAVMHDFGRERFPWRGTVLAVHVARLLSVLFGVTALYFTWRLVRALLPSHPGLALGTVAIQAFTPMFGYISATVNNDALTISLCTLTLWQIVRVFNKSLPHWRDLALIGTTAGLTILTKTSGLTLLPLMFVVSLWAARQRLHFEATPLLSRRALVVVSQFLLTCGTPIIAICGWWFWRNYSLYSDFLGMSAFMRVVGGRLYPPDLWAERFSLLNSYWGVFGWFNILMPNWIYQLLIVITVVGCWGAAAWVLCAVRTKKVCWTGMTWARLTVGGWLLVLFAAWLRYTYITPAAQGRLLFPAIGLLSLAIWTGVTSWFSMIHFHNPAKYAGLALGGLLMFLSAVAPWSWIAPRYPPLPSLASSDCSAIQERTSLGLDGHLLLLGYELPSTPLHPGDDLHVVLCWWSDGPSDVEYAIYIHLLGRGDRIVAQYDTFPMGGRILTTQLVPKQGWRETYSINIPRMAYAPDELQLAIGLYDIDTKARLPVQARIGSLSLLQHAPKDTLGIRFGTDVSLDEYHLQDLSAERGGALPLSLQWGGLRPMHHDYTVSLQIINDSEQKAGQLDRLLSPPTSNWQAGQTYTDTYSIAIAPDAVPGEYAVRLGLYRRDTADNLELQPVVWDLTRIADDYVILTKIHVR